MSQLSHMSGDSSQQLTFMQDQLRDKERCVCGGGRVMFILTLGILYFDSTRVLVIQIQRFYDFMKA